MRGAFMILTTPFTASGNVDWEDLAREAAFVDQGGAHGIVWPQGSSGVANLTNLMKKRGVFKTMATRTGGAAAWKVQTFELAADEITEIDYRLAALKPYLKVTS